MSRPPKLTKFMLKIRDRALARLGAGQSVDDVADYLFQCLPAIEQIEQIKTGGSLPLQRASDIAMERRRSRHQEQARQAREARRRHQEDQQREQQALQTMARVAERKREQGTVIRWLASLAPQMRDRLGTPNERKAAVALRKRSLTSSRVLERLGCTLTELDRWDQDGRLRHLYTRKIPLSSSHKVVVARFWLEDDVRQAAPQIEAWRQEHVTRKKAARTTPKLVRHQDKH